MLEKAAVFFKDIRTIWASMLFFASSFTGAFVWAGNQYWVQKTEYRADQKISLIQQLNLQIKDLKIRKTYAVDQQQKNMLEALIIDKETQIKNIKESK